MNVLGFDGTEVTTKAKYNTYCNLCRKKVFKGETVRSWPGHSFMVHQECGLVEGRMSNQEFRESVKIRKYKKKKQGKSTGSLRSANDFAALSRIDAKDCDSTAHSWSMGHTSGGSMP